LVMTLLQHSKLAARLRPARASGTAFDGAEGDAHSDPTY
jgi:hypothetical protein